MEHHATGAWNHALCDFTAVANLRCMGGGLHYQGWLFHDAVQEPGRLGAAKWPLIGLYDSVGLGVPNENGRELGTLSRAAGLGCLNPSDCHVHLVDLDDMFHMGSDMAQVTAEARPVVWSWVAVATPTTPTKHAEKPRGQASCDSVGACSWAVEVQLMMVVAPELEDTVERLLRKCDDGTNPVELVRQWDSSVSSLYDSSMTSALLASLLLGTGNH